MVSAIMARGHRVVRLPGGGPRSYGPHPSPPHHADWLGADWHEDAVLTHQVLHETDASWLVMDHYSLDQNWQAVAVPEGVRLLVVDDLADRPHRADVLLDQNAGRKPVEYVNLVPDGCDIRVGPAYALLRPEFARLRPEALVRRASVTEPQEALVTLGGVDIKNATGAVLSALARAPVASNMKVTVVMGAGAPHLDAVRKQALGLTLPVEVVVNAPDMARRMTEADICIGAAGSTAWERCALGLPALQVVLAENQVRVAQSLSKRGASLTLPAPDKPEFDQALERGLAQICMPKLYQAMVRRAAILTDGAGAIRVADCLMEPINA